MQGPLRRDEPFDGRVPPPDFANIETTRFCNLRCRMCIQFNDGTTVSGPHMEFAEFERIAQSIFPYITRWQPSVSGEPTMSQGFEAMLALAERFGVKMEMFSNGTLLSPRMIEKLAPSLGALSISFDGATAATFESIREGADFERVVAGIRNLVAHCRQHLPAEFQPLLSLNCTLMERNIRELPQLVRFAGELGLDQLSCYHVFPVTDEMRTQSLVHHRELARACIDDACAAAAEVGVTLNVQALDQLTAATAVDPAKRRAIPTKDGVVEGLEQRTATHGTRRRWPELDPDHPDHAAIQARRAAARATSGFPEEWQGVPATGESVWCCDFLWHKTYVSIGGDVRACCVDGNPVLGNLVQEPFEQAWNNDNYRNMRLRLTAKAPAPTCRGCMHIREEHDPVQVARLLQGHRAPRADELPELPPALDPTRRRRQRSGPPPELTWPATPGATSYVLEFSLDAFGSILFATDGPMGGPAIRSNRYQVPPWAWRDAPVDRTIHYRVLACLPGERREVARGEVGPEPPPG
jgi:MoaA/NifB/PqqE/SkfB family radical SAM enzyme